MLFRQRQAAVAIAGGDNHIAKAGVAKGGDNRFPHAAAALNHHAGMGIQLVAVDQALHRDIVGVESGQSAVVVNDGIDGINYPGRRIDGVKEGHAALFKRHRDRATANPQRPYPSHRGGDILRGKGFIDKIQPQFLIQIVVKTGTEVAWPPASDMQS